MHTVAQQKRFTRKALQATALTILAMTAGSAFAHKAHVHGKATLEVVQDGNQVTVQLEGALDNFLGFEHAPRTDAQKKAVAQMVARLSAADALVPTAAAQCKVEPVQLVSEVLGMNGTAQPKAETKKESGKKKDDHGDLDATWKMTCAQPNALTSIDQRWLASFERLKRLDVSVVAGAAPKAMRLTPKSTVVNLK